MCLTCSFSFTYHIECEVSVILGLEFPLAWLYRREQADAVQTFKAFQLCQGALLTQQRQALF